MRDGRRGGAEHVAARRRRKANQGQRGPGERSRQEPLLRVSFFNLFFGSYVANTYPFTESYFIVLYTERSSVAFESDCILERYFVDDNFLSSLSVSQQSV